MTTDITVSGRDAPWMTTDITVSGRDRMTTDITVSGRDVPWMTTDITVSGRDAPWMTTDIKTNLQEKTMLYKKYAKNGYCYVDKIKANECSKSFSEAEAK